MAIGGNGGLQVFFFLLLFCCGVLMEVMGIYIIILYTIIYDYIYSWTSVVAAVVVIVVVCCTIIVDNLCWWLLLMMTVLLLLLVTSVTVNSVLCFHSTSMVLTTSF